MDTQIANLLTAQTTAPERTDGGPSPVDRTRDMPTPRAPSAADISGSPLCGRAAHRQNCSDMRSSRTSLHTRSTPMGRSAQPSRRPDRLPNAEHRGAFHRSPNGRSRHTGDPTAGALSGVEISPFRGEQDISASPCSSHPFRLTDWTSRPGPTADSDELRRSSGWSEYRRTSRCGRTRPVPVPGSPPRPPGRDHRHP